MIIFLGILGFFGFGLLLESFDWGIIINDGCKLM